MHFAEWLFVFGSAMLAGAINSVAGGGTFFTFPALILTGMNPIAANATSTAAVWPGSLASVFGFREELHRNRHRMPSLIACSLLGGLLGASILLLTPETTFAFLIPWLLLIATCLFAFGPHITRIIHDRMEGRARPAWMVKWGSMGVQLLIGIYGGYFGAGIGILMLALLNFMKLENIHEMNGLKTVLASAINGIAVVTFVLAGIIVWNVAAVMIVGAAIGGYYGARISRRLPAVYVRRFVIATGVLMTLYFFLK